MDLTPLINAVGAPLALGIVAAVALWRTMVGVGKWLGARADKTIDRAHAFLDNLESAQRSQQDTIRAIAGTQDQIAATQQRMAEDIARFRCYYVSGVTSDVPAP